MKVKIKHNIGLKILSLVVSAFLWLIIINVSDPIMTNEEIGEYKVQNINEDILTDNDKDYSVLEGAKVKVLVTARRSYTDKLKKSGFNVTADMYNMLQGKDGEVSTVPIVAEPKSYSREIDSKFITVVPNTQKISIQNVISNDYVIEPKFENKPAEGFDVNPSPVFKPSKVTITGPEQIINTIDKVKIRLNIKGLSEDREINNEAYVLYDKDGKELGYEDTQKLSFSPENRTVKALIEAWKVEEGFTLTPEIEGQPADGYTFTGYEIFPDPKTVRFSGSEEALARFEEDGREIKASNKVKIYGMDDTSDMVVDIKADLAEYGLKLENDVSTTFSVTVKIEKNISKTLEIPVSSIVVNGKAEDLDISYKDVSTLSIPIKGSKSAVDAITNDTITVSLDLTDKRAGTYVITPTVTGLSDDIVKTLDPITIDLVHPGELEGS